MDNPNNKQYKYTVGILIFHRTQELVDMGIECLDSVLRNINRDDTEVIIVDNGSTVQSDVWAKNADTYIRFNENKGISRGWNAILKNARGKYINILGDDTKVTNGWLEALQEAMDMPDAGVVNIHVEHLPADIGIVETYKWFSGACFMLTQNTIDKAGYFDENIFPCNWEDTDYWLRVFKAGLKLYRNYNKSIRHLEGQTVHAKDLSHEFMRIKEYIVAKHGFDPQPFFYGHEDLYGKLGITKSNS